MHENITRILNHLRGLRSQRWCVIAMAWLVCLGGWTVIYFLPDRYQATAKVVADTQTVLKPLLKGLAVQTDVNDRLSQLTNMLTSRPTLEKVARLTDMDLDVKNDQDMDALVERLGKTIKLTGGRNNAYTISYIDHERDRAKKVVESVLNLLVESSLGDSRLDSGNAQKFLDQQIANYESQLVAAEEKLKEFKRANVGLMPAENQGYYERLNSAKQDAAAATLALNEAIQRRDELRRQLDSEQPTVNVSLSQLSRPDSPMEKELAEAHRVLDELRRQFTDRHPDVVAAQARLDATMEQAAANLGLPTGGDANAVTAIESNRAYQELRVSLGEAEGEVASLTARVSAFRRRVTELTQLVDTIPRVEAELTRLNRDYDIHKAQYEELLKRKESAKLSQEAESETDNVKFKIIDPPFVPTLPSAPNRLMLSALVFVAGIAAGVLAGILRGQLRPVFFTRQELGETLGLPVYGAVPVVSTPLERRQSRLSMAGFGATVTVLSALFGAISFMYVIR